MTQKKTLFYHVMRLLAAGDQLNRLHWEEHKRGDHTWETIRSEFNAVLQKLSDQKFTGLDKEIE